MHLRQVRVRCQLSDGDESREALGQGPPPLAPSRPVQGTAGLSSGREQAVEGSCGRFDWSTTAVTPGGRQLGRGFVLF